VDFYRTPFSRRGDASPGATIECGRGVRFREKNGVNRLP
jgi:hypothetical protein